jgi:hypothetical protein
MKKINHKIFFFGTIFLLTVFTFIACRKNFNSSIFEESTTIMEAKAHLSGLVNSEKSLLDLP